jgi:hypothetical protein
MDPSGCHIYRLGTYQQLGAAIPRSQEWMMKNLKPHQNQMLQEVLADNEYVSVGWKSTEDTQGDYFTNPFKALFSTGSET